MALRILFILIICSLLAVNLEGQDSGSSIAGKDAQHEISWHREGTYGIDGKTRYTYFASGKEYLVRINVNEKFKKLINKKGQLFTAYFSPYRKEAYLKRSNVEWLSSPNTVYYSKKDAPNGIPVQAAVYDFLIKTADSVAAIEMITFYERDTAFEQRFVLSILNNGINNDHFLKRKDSSFSFAGRIIRTDVPFLRMGPDNIYCSEQGQMSWTYHKNLQNAQRAKAVYIESNTNIKRAQVIRTDTVNIIFEGIPQTAARVQYLVKSGIFPFKKITSVLNVFYVTTELRGRFVSCILSYFNEDAKNGTLPPPLNSVIKLE